MNRGFIVVVCIVLIIGFFAAIYEFGPTISYAQDVKTIEAKKQTKAQQQTTNSQKPLKFYAVHIGPSKTGTSAIQKELRNNPFGVNTLAKDNLIYVGLRQQEGWWDPNLETEIRKTSNGTISLSANDEQKLHTEAVRCMVEKLENYYDSRTENRETIDRLLEEDAEIRESLRSVFTNECWAKTKINSRHKKTAKINTYDARYMLDYSIFDSSEFYSFYQKESGKSSYDTIGIRFRCFDILGYKKLVVVGAYRRYGAWIVSAYTQQIKPGCTTPNLEGNLLAHTCAKLRTYLDAVMNRKGYEHYNCRNYDNIHHTLPKIALAGPSNLETKILNFFQLPQPNAKGYDSITTELFCDALGEELVPHSCRHARNNALLSSSTSSSTSPSTSLVNNKGTTSNSVYQSIVSTAHLLGFIVPTKQEVQTRKQKCLDNSKKVWCENDGSCVSNKDEGACDNLNKKRRDNLKKFSPVVVVGDTTSNITTWKDLSDYHSKVHGLAWINTLPVQCPKRKMLDELLTRSLELEELIMPEFYATPLGREEHERIFNDVWLEGKKLFCWVDLNRLFRGASSWDEIINERMVNFNWTTSDEA